MGWGLWGEAGFAGSCPAAFGFRTDTVLVQPAAEDCGESVDGRSSGQHGRSSASPGAATGIAHRPAAICATRNTHQRLSALSVVPTGSYLSYQCSLRPVPVVATLTFRGAYFTFSIFTNPDSEDALCEVLQIDEIPTLRTTDPSPHQPKRHDSGQHRPASWFLSNLNAYSHLDISAKRQNQRDFQKKTLENSDGNANPRFIEILWASPHE
ncbi:hypothetical protein BTHE_1211 [Bifidobacterium thermophilum]|nr:hypothetical protein BTHE_1211 [Bifidobacterium thermophilum]